MKDTQEIQNWEKEFDEKFAGADGIIKWDDKLKVATIPSPEVLKSFISTLLKSQEAKHKREVLEEEIKYLRERHYPSSQDMAVIADIITHLSNEIKELE